VFSNIISLLKHLKIQFQGMLWRPISIHPESIVNYYAQSSTIA